VFIYIYSDEGAYRSFVGVNHCDGI